MGKRKLIIAGVLIALAISAAFMVAFDIQSEDYVYVQSDITKDNPKLMMASGTHYMIEDIERVKHAVLLTVSGTVQSVGDPTEWDYEGETYGSVPVTIEIDKKTKDVQTELELKKGDEFTFYLGGVYMRDLFFINSHEPQFEPGENVIVHIGKSDPIPLGSDGDNYYVELGKFGKYRIVEGKAYNEKHPNGKSLEKAFDEAK